MLTLGHTWHLSSLALLLLLLPLLPPLLLPWLLLQLGAGHTFKLMPEVFTWKGFAGTFAGFGLSIAPLEE